MPRDWNARLARLSRMSWRAFGDVSSVRNQRVPSSSCRCSAIGRLTSLPSLSTVVSIASRSSPMRSFTFSAAAASAVCGVSVWWLMAGSLPSAAATGDRSAAARCCSSASGPQRAAIGPRFAGAVRSAPGGGWAAAGVGGGSISTSRACAATESYLTAQNALSGPTASECDERLSARAAVRLGLPRAAARRRLGRRAARCARSSRGCVRAGCRRPVACGADRARHEPAAAVGADVVQQRVDAVGAERALERADARVRRGGWERDGAVLAAWAEFQHQANLGGTIRPPALTRAAVGSTIRRAGGRRSRRRAWRCPRRGTG